MRTICTNCKHHLQQEEDTELANCWHNHFCMAFQLTLWIDPVDGVQKPHDGYVAALPRIGYKYCRDINLIGNCPVYAQKKGKK